MDRQIDITSIQAPAFLEPGPVERPQYLAVELAALYLMATLHPRWQLYHWCLDTDGAGQRVYVGCNGHGFEIHRHIHLTDRFVTPIRSA